MVNIKVKNKEEEIESCGEVQHVPGSTSLIPIIQSDLKDKFTVYVNLWSLELQQGLYACYSPIISLWI